MSRETIDWLNENKKRLQIQTNQGNMLLVDIVGEERLLTYDLDDLLLMVHEFMIEEGLCIKTV